MVKTMNKEVLVRLPLDIYTQLKQFSQIEYKSMSAVIRETLIDKLQDSFTLEQSAEIEAQRKAFYDGKGTNWRDIKRG